MVWSVWTSNLFQILLVLNIVINISKCFNIANCINNTNSLCHIQISNLNYCPKNNTKCNELCDSSNPCDVISSLNIIQTNANISIFCNDVYRPEICKLSPSISTKSTTITTKSKQISTNIDSQDVKNNGV